jgi:hypothetical protein
MLTVSKQNNRLLIIVAFASAAVQWPVFAQDPNIQASINGAGGYGKCTFEVVVDGTADVQIQGDRGYLNTLSGRPAIWRRLDCNQPLPRHAENFQFRAIHGRGSQTLVGDPNSNRGTAIIRINDPKAGDETYTADLTWGGRYSSDTSANRYEGNYGSNYGGPGWSSRVWGYEPPSRFAGSGTGDFNRDGGPRYDLRGVTVNIDRSNDSVTASFDSTAGLGVFSFAGRITLMDVNNIEADLISGNRYSNTAPVSGRMKIRLNKDGSVRSVDMKGAMDGGRFNLAWRD